MTVYIQHYFLDLILFYFILYSRQVFYYFLKLFYCCSSTVVSIFPYHPHLPPLSLLHFGRWEGIMGSKGGRVFRNIYQGHVDKTLFFYYFQVYNIVVRQSYIFYTVIPGYFLYHPAVLEISIFQIPTIYSYYIINYVFYAVLFTSS